MFKKVTLFVMKHWLNLLKGWRSITTNRSSQSRSRCSFWLWKILFNLLKGLRSVCSNRSSSQVRKSVSFGSPPVDQFPSKDSALVAATVHHRKVETVSPSDLDLSINLFEGRTSNSSNRSSSQSRNSFSFGSRPVHQFV